MAAMHGVGNMVGEESHTERGRKSGWAGPVFSLGVAAVAAVRMSNDHTSVSRHMGTK